MAIYAIGDIQGCYKQLKDLLKKLKFKSDKDQLWFAGDIINRGPDSLKTLRFIKSLQGNAITVLGNHDLHFLAVAYGKRQQGRKDTIQEILDAKDCAELINWMQHLPLMHYQKENNVCLVHAGIHPLWSRKQALKYAGEVQTVLQGADAHKFFKQMYGDSPLKWSDSLTGWPRLRFITNSFTRMRYVNDELDLCLKEKGAPEKQQNDFYPWFEFEPKEPNLNIIFGHWSTLKDPKFKHLYPLDTGCLWGGELSALKVNSKMNKLTSIKCPKSLSFD